MVKKFTPYDPYGLGSTDAITLAKYISSGNRLVEILNFGQPCSGSSGYGAWAYDTNCHSVGEIQSDVQNYIAGICAYFTSLHNVSPCGATNQSLPALTVAIGTNNYGSGASPQHAQAWGQMVISVTTSTINSGYHYQILVAAANDMELAWNTAANTRSWVDAYSAVTTARLYNFGSCDGCPNGMPNNWTVSDIWWVSWGNNNAYAFPEIYRRDGWHAYVWRSVSETASTQLHVSPIYFSGALTQWQACQQTQSCYNSQLPTNSTDNASSQAVPQLSVELILSSDSATRNTVTTLGNAADISWYPRSH